MWSLKTAAAHIVGSLLCYGVVTHARAQITQPLFESGEVIIGYRSPTARDQAVRALNRDKNRMKVRGEPIEQLQLKVIGNTAVKLRITPSAKVRGENANDRARELQTLKDIASRIRKADRRVEYAHPNWIIQASPTTTSADPIDPNTIDWNVPPDTIPPNDPTFFRRLHWHYQAPPVGMNAVGAWKFETGKTEIVVAVVDSGMLFDHPDIRDSGNVLRGYNFVTKESRKPDATDPGNTCPLMAPWHGTQVAGIIGAVGSNNRRGMTGINWQISVLPVRVLGVCGGTLEDIADGIRWAAGLTVDGVPVNKHPAHVINISITAMIPCDLENAGHLIKAIESARAAGSIVVVAAGNFGKDIKDFYPAGCKGVISVAASDIQGRLAYYSNHGNVTIMAPGGDTNQKDDVNRPAGIWTTLQISSESPQGVKPAEGTSMAAPHVSAAIALALAKHPEWRRKPDLIEEKLRNSAASLILNACDKPCGAGQLDAARLITGP